MLAIKADDNADNAIGNVTGSNSVNVFLGCGLPWLFSAIYWSSSREPTELWLQKYGPGSGVCWGGGCENGVPKGFLKWQEKVGWPENKAAPPFVVQKGKLGPSLVLYVLLTFIALIFLTARRFVVGAEMGGSNAQNYASAAFMISLWFIYLLLVSLQDYGYGTLSSLSSIV